MKIQHIHFETIGSTNTWAKEQCAHFNPAALTVVTADGQTAGRGRYQRRWHSPPHQNIYATYCFFLNSSRTDIGNVPQVLAIAAVELLNQKTFQSRLKWPNDILLNGKKMGGILTEAVTQGDQTCLIAGIGLNINMAQNLLDQIDQPATSLKAESGEEWDVVSLRDALTQHFLSYLNTFLIESFSPFFPLMQSYLHHQQGDSLRCRENGEVKEGIFKILHSDGSLSLQTQEGKLLRFHSGEIISFS